MFPSFGLTGGPLRIALGQRRELEFTTSAEKMNRVYAPIFKFNGFFTGDQPDE
jgi:hypothetical protein